MTRPGGTSALRFVALAAVTFGAVAVALRIGAAHLNFALAFRDPTGLDRAVLSARGARVALGALAGGALAMVGAAFQGVLRNPLGDPFALGVSGGAALGATVGVTLGFSGLGVPAAAFAGALGATVLVLAAARATGRVDGQSMLLAGLVFNACAGAGVVVVRTSLDAAKAQETLSLLLGNVAEERWSTVAAVAGLVAAGTVVLVLLAKPLTLLALGEESAASLGVDVRVVEVAAFIAASLLVGGVVSVCGLIPFVGLIVPHYARAVVGSDQRRLLPACLLMGAALLVLADAATRALFGVLGSEVPVGAITALVGGPFFFVLLRRR